MRRWLVAALVATTFGAGCSGIRTEPRAWEGPRLDVGEVELAAALRPYRDCGELEREMRAEVGRELAMMRRGGGVGGGDEGVPEMGTAVGGSPVGLAAGAAADGAAPAHSGTNVQEAGIDEPDLVKTDGRLLVAVVRDRLRVVDVRGEPRLLSTLKLPAGYGTSLFLVGDRVVVLGPSLEGVRPAPESRPGAEPRASRSGAMSGADVIASPTLGGGSSEVMVVSLEDPASPRVVRRTVLEGDIVDGRLVEGRPRLVLRSWPTIVPSAAAARGVDAADVLPALREGDEEPRPMVACEEVSRPAEPAGRGMVSVVAVDPDSGEVGDAATVVGDATTVYATGRRLYVATTRWGDPTDDQAGGPSTDLHRFDLSGSGPARYEGSGRVPGGLLNQFSLSEHEDVLRVATTIETGREGGSESVVTSLRLEDGALRAIGEVGGLGRTERIYAVRFLGDRGFVVTFRQTDPLYVLDLSDPTRPTVTGELKINGYSAYLHPVGDHLLLGVGQDATDEGRRLGTQVSLFDVSDPAAPKRLANTVLPDTGSEVETTHRAFLWWQPARLAVVPVSPVTPEGRPAAIGFTVGSTSIAEAGRVAHPVGADPWLSVIRRSVVVGDRLYTLSEQGLLASDLRTLADREWLRL